MKQTIEITLAEKSAAGSIAKVTTKRWWPFKDKVEIFTCSECSRLGGAIWVTEKLHEAPYEITSKINYAAKEIVEKRKEEIRRQLIQVRSELAAMKDIKNEK